MNAEFIQEKIRFITDAKGRRKSAVIPYNLYEELMLAKISQEYYEREATQASIKRAEKDIEAGRIHKFETLEEAFNWLDSP